MVFGAGDLALRVPASGIARAAMGAARRAVQPVGGGTLAAAAAVLVAYGLWQVFRWGGREHQPLIGSLAFLPVDWCVAGRYGGDEFTIVAPGCTSRRAARLAGELSCPAARVTGRDGKPLAYPLSIGIAQCPPGGDLPALLTQADQAMYQAKRAGGNCWRIFRPATGAEPGSGHAGRRGDARVSQRNSVAWQP